MMSSRELQVWFSLLVALVLLGVGGAVAGGAGQRVVVPADAVRTDSAFLDGVR